ncbi:MAG: non-canonical purine NTP pyrophosphatase [Fimbriimonadales bacterium]|jgi:XTP/dITP diphosphohydrolase|nr:non-canonical purine NTP pyrophosphatase [Fimbriimonadales bacterium]CUU10734.1 XTP/dITP diphosphohydrolase [Armatimonadetes bacterium GBS]CUU38791.1 XTP/dITP diphosphohydrolase [Armatimonadetes bacterium GXS]
MAAKRFVIASHNRSKSKEIAMLLEQGLRDLGVEVALLADYPNAPQPDETADTYVGNAIIKARACAQFTGEIALADDAGLEIDALNGQPGRFSRRFAGEATPFPVKMGILLNMLSAVPDERRTARFRCAIAIATPAGDLYTFEDTLEGRIAQAPRGQAGFGYDPIFYVPELGCTLAELPSEFKNRISHRARVMRQAMPTLRALFQQQE